MVSLTDPKKRIINVLREHPEGLTLQKLAKLTKMNRLTATKYVHELIGGGVIYQRKVGIAKLCYLKSDFVREVEEKKIISMIKERLEKD